MSFTRPGMACAGAGPGPGPWRPIPRLAADIKSVSLATLRSPGRTSIRATGWPSTRMAWSCTLYFIVRSATVDRLATNILRFTLMHREPDAASIYFRAQAPTFRPHLLGCLDEIIRHDVLVPVERKLASQDVCLPNLGEREAVHDRRCRSRRRCIEPPGAQPPQIVLAKLRRGRCEQGDTIKPARSFGKGGTQRRWVVGGGDHYDAVFGGQPVHAGQEAVEGVPHGIGVTGPNLVDILQDHQRRRLRYCGLEHIAELIRAVFRRPEIDSKRANCRMARHDAGDGRFSIAGRSI